MADRLDSTPSFLVADELDRKRVLVDQKTQNNSLTHHLTATRRIDDHNGGSKADNCTENEEDKLLRIIEDFAGSKSFDWLIQQIRAFAFSSRGMSLLNISTDLLDALTKFPSNVESPGALFSVDADLKTYLEGSSDGCSSLRSIICVNADGEHYEAITLDEYMARMWPMTGVRFLEILQEWMEIAEDKENKHRLYRKLVTRFFPRIANIVRCVHHRGSLDKFF